MIENDKIRKQLRRYAEEAAEIALNRAADRNERWALIYAGDAAYWYGRIDAFKDWQQFKNKLQSTMQQED